MFVVEVLQWRMMCWRFEKKKGLDGRLWVNAWVVPSFLALGQCPWERGRSVGVFWMCSGGVLPFFHRSGSLAFVGWVSRIACGVVNGRSLGLGLRENGGMQGRQVW